MNSKKNSSIKKDHLYTATFEKALNFRPAYTEIRFF